MIGSSIGLRAAELGWRVTGWDVAARHLERALELGAVAHAATSLDELAEGADVLILATPLDVTLRSLAALAAAPPRARLIIDVASVKGPVAAAGRSLEAFVATHPVAGSERSGPEAARADLFLGRTWTYDALAPEPARTCAASFISTLGAKPLAIENDEHDRILALTSHLPQVVAVALGAQLSERSNDPAVTALCGSGMHSMLRLGASAWATWGPIYGANADPVAQEVRRLATILNGIAEALEAERTGALEDCFEAAARIVALLGENGGALATVARPLD